MTVETLSKKIKPSIVVVTLKSSVQGNEFSPNWQAAKRLRGRIVSYIWNKCVYTEYGLLCPDDATPLLDIAISKAKLEADLFNNKFEDAQVKLRVMRSLLEKEAVELVAEEIVDAQIALDNAVESRDVVSMRKSADKLANLAEFLQEDSREEFALKVQEARKTATITAAAAREPEKAAARELKNAEKERKKLEKEQARAEREEAKRAKKDDREKRLAERAEAKAEKARLKAEKKLLGDSSATVRVDPVSRAERLRAQAEERLKKAIADAEAKTVKAAQARQDADAKAKRAAEIAEARSKKKELTAKAETLDNAASSVD